jgi:hypothetical protein
MIIIHLTHDQLIRAEHHYKHGALRGSMTEGRSNIYGAISEIAVGDYYDTNWQHYKKGLFAKIVDRTNCYDKDLIVNGKRIDVKGKHTTVEPKWNYFCSVSDWNTKQKCDYYLFARVTVDRTLCYIIGEIAKERFFQEAKFFKKGEIDPYSINTKSPFVFVGDCYNVEAVKLDQINEPHDENAIVKIISKPSWAKLI